MSFNLFLDDFRSPMCLKDVRTWEVVRSYKEFVQKITERGLPNFISFDHDLCYEDINKTDGFKEKTGYDCAKWLINYCQEKKLPLPEWQVHSLNPVGRTNINELLIKYKEAECL